MRKERRKEKEVMKIKPLILLVLLALPMVMIAAPTHAVANPHIWVNPGETKLWAPCQVSNEITVDIKLWNKKEITGVSIYAYDLKVTWDADLLSFVKAEVISPWPEGKYYIVKNVYNETGDEYYQLAVTALDTSPPLDDVQIVLVRITLHVEKEPCWDAVYSTSIDVFDVKLSDACGTPITGTVVTDGTVIIESSQPALWLDPEEWGSACICKDQVISVMASNLTSVYGFELKVTWNNSKLLEANIQCVHVTDLIAPPYEEYKVEVGTNFVYVKVVKPCTKPTVSCVEGPLVTICFHTKFDDLGTALPAAEDVALSIVDAKILAKCPQPVEITPTVKGSLYEWRPKVEDLDLSCHVDIVDLAAIAGAYGKASVWTQLAESKTDPVDIYDIVVVAKKFCKTQ